MYIGEKKLKNPTILDARWDDTLIIFSTGLIPPGGSPLAGLAEYLRLP